MSPKSHSQAGDVIQLIECLPSVDEALDFVSREVDAESLEVHSEFTARLDYMRSRYCGEWRDGSTAKDTCRSCRGLAFGFQHS